MLCTVVQEEFKSIIRSIPKEKMQAYMNGMKGGEQAFERAGPSRNLLSLFDDDAPSPAASEGATEGGFTFGSPTPASSGSTETFDPSLPQNVRAPAHIRSTFSLPLASFSSRLLLVSVQYTAVAYSAV